MPRSFDSDGSPQALEFTELVECPRCGETFEGSFLDYSQSLSVEDITDPPEGVHECPGCELSFRTQMTGWMFYSEAG